MEALGGQWSKVKGRRSKVGWGWVALLVLLAGAGGGVWWWGGKDGDEAPALRQEEPHLEAAFSNDAEKEAVADRDDTSAPLREEASRLQSLAKEKAVLAERLEKNRGLVFKTKVAEMNAKFSQGEEAFERQEFKRAKVCFAESLAAAGWVETNSPLRDAAIKNLHLANKAKGEAVKQGASGYDDYQQGEHHFQIGTNAFQKAHYDEASREFEVAQTAFDCAKEAATKRKLQEADQRAREAEQRAKAAEAARRRAEVEAAQQRKQRALDEARKAEEAAKAKNKEEDWRGAVEMAAPPMRNVISTTNSHVATGGNRGTSHTLKYSDVSAESLRTKPQSYWAGKIRFADELVMLTSEKLRLDHKNYSAMQLRSVGTVWIPDEKVQTFAGLKPGRLYSFGGTVDQFSRRYYVVVDAVFELQNAIPSSGNDVAGGGGNDSGYVLMVGDMVTIILKGIPNGESIDDIIDEKGYVSLPFIDEVKAAGFTAAQLEKSIRDMYRNRVISKNVDVQVLVPSRYYYMQGEIRVPGRVQLVSAVRLSQAIAASGGGTEFWSGKVEVKRNNGKTVTVRNAKRLAQTPGDDILLEPGDIVELKRSWF